MVAPKQDKLHDFTRYNEKISRAMKHEAARVEQTTDHTRPEALLVVSMFTAFNAVGPIARLHGKVCPDMNQVGAMMGKLMDFIDELPEDESEVSP